MHSRKREVSAAYKKEQEAVSRYYSRDHGAKVKLRIRQNYAPIIFAVRIVAAILQQTFFVPGIVSNKNKINEIYGID